MAFENKNMSVIAYANGFTLWHYKSTSDTIADISEPEYFNKIHTLCYTGDIVIINAANGTAIKAIVLESDCVKLEKVQI